MVNVDIIRLEPSQIKRAAEVVASAFFNYPMLAYYFPDLNRRKRWLPWYMENALKCALRYGEAFVTSDFSGVIFILTPGHTRLTNLEYLKNGFIRLPFVMGFRNFLKSEECETFVEDTHQRLLNGREHYYIWGLVADPKTQRKGVGNALLKPLLDKADAENMPVYLETHDRNNILYYERFGFKLIHTDKIPKHGLDVWSMLREAPYSP